MTFSVAVVVENDDISMKIIQLLTQEKGDRGTFIPLNRVKVRDINCPESSDFVPLLKKLKYRTDQCCAFEQVLYNYIFTILFDACTFHWDNALYLYNDDPL
jgi:chromosome segregation ATPase